MDAANRWEFPLFYRCHWQSPWTAPMAGKCLPLGLWDSLGIRVQTTCDHFSLSTLAFATGLLDNRVMWGLYINRQNTEPRQPWSWVQSSSLYLWPCSWPGSLGRVVPPGCPQVRHVCQYSAASSPWRSPCFICNCSSGGRHMEMSIHSILGLSKSHLRCSNLFHH